MKISRQTFFSSISSHVSVSHLGLLEVQREGLNQLLDFLESDQDARWGTGAIRIRRMSYFLATVQHECTVLTKVGNRKLYVPVFHPIEEMGGTSYLNRMYDTRVDLGNTPQHDGDGAKYAGDGYVQNTGKSNARKTGRRLVGVKITFEDLPANDAKIIAAFTREGGSQRTPVAVDSETFVREHELLRVPKISYLDSADGFLSGRYTGHKIADYIDEDTFDTFGARRVINGITAKNRPKVIEIQEHTKHFVAALTASITEEDEGNSNDFAGTIVGSDAVNISSEVIADPNSLPVPLPVTSESGEEVPQPEPSNQYTAFIPHIDSAKSWLKRGFSGTVVGTAWAFYTNQPMEIRIAFIGLLFTLIITTVIVFIKYHKQIFDLVLQINQLNANTPASFVIKPHK
jgi:hypothetical protein